MHTIGRFASVLVAGDGGDEQLGVGDGHGRHRELKNVRDVVCSSKDMQSPVTTALAYCVASSCSGRAPPVKLSILTVPPLPPCGPMM